MSSASSKARRRSAARISRPFSQPRRIEFAADVAVISDTRMLGADRPAITYGMRGALSVEVEAARAGDRSALGQFWRCHSQPSPGTVRTARQSARRARTGCHPRLLRSRCVRSTSGNAPTWPASERATQEILRSARAEVGWGERGFTLGERIAVRPALTINGLTGGYQGPGAKSIIPSRARAKLNFRLVARSRTA